MDPGQAQAGHALHARTANSVLGAVFTQTLGISRGRIVFLRSSLICSRMGHPPPFWATSSSVSSPLL